MPLAVADVIVNVSLLLDDEIELPLADTLTKAVCTELFALVKAPLATSVIEPPLP